MRFLISILMAMLLALTPAVVFATTSECGMTQTVAATPDMAGMDMSGMAGMDMPGMDMPGRPTVAAPIKKAADKPCCHRAMKDCGGSCAGMAVSQAAIATAGYVAPILTATRVVNTLSERLGSSYEPPGWDPPPRT